MRIHEHGVGGFTAKTRCSRSATAALVLLAACAGDVEGPPREPVPEGLVLTEKDAELGLHGTYARDGVVIRFGSTVDRDAEVQQAYFAAEDGTQLGFLAGYNGEGDDVVELAGVPIVDLTPGALAPEDVDRITALRASPEGALFGQAVRELDEAQLVDVQSELVGLRYLYGTLTAVEADPAEVYDAFEVTGIVAAELGLETDHNCAEKLAPNIAVPYYAPDGRTY